MPPIDPAPGRALPELTGLARSIVGLPRLAVRRRTLPAGRGPLMVIPGFMTSDRSTILVRRFLADRGYDVIGWGLGLNRGNVAKLLPRVIERAERHADGRSLQLVGWSLGGVLAREVARARPGLVKSIVTMGTPVVGGPKYTAAAQRYARKGHDLDAIEREIAERNARPLDVPITAIYSRRDQVVSWQACLDPNPHNRVDHIEVSTGHIGMGFDTRTLRTVAEVLARHL